MPRKGLLLLRQAGCRHASRHRTPYPAEGGAGSVERLIDAVHCGADLRLEIVVGAQKERPAEAGQDGRP